MFDLISIGDCTIDHVFKLSDASLNCLEKDRCQLCLGFGRKIPVDKYSQTVAGNNANSVVGVSYLGLKTAIYTNVGSDGDGERVIKKLKQFGVETRFIKINEGMESNVSAVVSFQGERTILVYHQPWEYQLPDLDKTKWVYLSSMSETFVKSNIISQVENYLERSGAKLAFNPGTFQLKAGVKKFPRLLSLTSLFIINLEEAKLILGISDEEKVEIKKILRKLADLGPERVVITNSKEGSFGFEGEKYFSLGVFPAEVVDTTGAGDAYSSGLLAGLIYGNNLKEALRWGAANSASVIGKVGSQAGFLTYEKMIAKLEEYSKIVAKEI